MIEINYSNLENFWKWLVDSYPKNAYTEIRLMGVKDDRIYSVVDIFRKENPNIIIKNNTQFFIQTFSDLVKIMSYRNNIFIRYSKMCYSLNPRFFINGEITGGYDNLKTQNKIFFDIEKTNHEALSDIERDRIESKFLMDVTMFLRRYNLNHPTVIRSGNGLHLIYKITPKPISEGRKESYREFINDIKDKLDNNLFHIDFVIDATRTVAIPESINPKNDFKVHYTILGGINDFFIKAKHIRKPKIKPQIENETTMEMEVRKSLVWKILINNPPVGDRNNLLVYYLKILIRDTDDDYRIYQRELNAIFHEQWRMNPLGGIKGKTRQFGLLVNYCKKNEQWCQEKGINYKEYRY